MIFCAQEGKQLKTIAALLMGVALTLAAQQTPVASSTARAEALAACVALEDESVPLTKYGLAKASAISLWYAKAAHDRGVTLQSSPKKSESMLSARTDVIASTKFATNDFYCAKRAVRKFAAQEVDEEMSTVAQSLMIAYVLHIELNERMADIAKKFMKGGDEVELMDALTSIQAERKERWEQIILPYKMMFMLLLDRHRGAESQAITHVVVKKAEKDSLLSWVNKNFPELSNGTPEKRTTIISIIASQYSKIFEGMKCADE